MAVASGGGILALRLITMSNAANATAATPIATFVLFGIGCLVNAHKLFSGFGNTNSMRNKDPISIAVKKKPIASRHLLESVFFGCVASESRCNRCRGPMIISSRYVSTMPIIERGSTVSIDRGAATGFFQVYSLAGVRYNMVLPKRTSI